MTIKNNRYNNRYKILPTEYASFSLKILNFFISNVLTGKKIIFDPMCGAAPLIPYVEKNGLIAYFNDILPVHYHINKAKVFRVYASLKRLEKSNENFLYKELIYCMKSLKRKKMFISDDWIHDDILRSLIEAWKKDDGYETPIRYLIKALILLCVRPYSCISSSGNPSWVKKGGASSGKDLTHLLKERIKLFLLFYRGHYYNHEIKKKGQCHFSRKDATPLYTSKRFDLILTSPSYCNRLDYERLYAPELYFLESLDYRIGPSNVLGTTKVIDYDSFKSDLNNIIKCAPKTGEFLQEVGMKKERDAEYYQRYYTRYYANLFKILKNSLRFLKDSGEMYIVVQDNIHRGEINDMGKFLSEFYNNLGWSVEMPFRELRHHQGRRNISAEHPIVIKKHYETILRVKKC